MTGPADNRRRRDWLRALLVVRASAQAPESDAVAVEMLRALRGLDAATFPLPAGDVRLKAVRAFGEVARMWCAVGAHTRTPFASSMGALAGDLERLLIDQGHAMAGEQRERQRLD